MCIAGDFIVMQRRISNALSFERCWNSYVTGFGTENENFWLGLYGIRALTQNQPTELKVEMEAFNGETAYAHYSHFSVGDSAARYVLSLSGYSGTAGDSMGYNNGYPFSTFDDDVTSESCVEERKSGWWHNGCTWVNPNGLYLVEGSNQWFGILWYGWKGIASIKKIEMFLLVP